MTNSEQILANNERIEALTEILKNKSAGGGLEIKGNLKQCEAGEALEAGDFVKTEKSVDVASSITYNSVSYVPTIQELSTNKFFVAGNKYTAAILKIDDNFTHTEIAQTTSFPIANCSAPYVSIPYDETKFLVFCGYGTTTNQYIYGAVVEVVNDTITVLKTTQLTTKGYTWGYAGFLQHCFGVERVSENKFIVTGTGTKDRFLHGYIVEVNPDDYSMTEVASFSGSAARMYSNIIPIDENNYMDVDGYNYTTGINIALRTLSESGNTETRLKTYTMSTGSTIHKLVKIDNDNIAMFYSEGNGTTAVTVPTKCIVYNIPSGTLTEDVEVADRRICSMPIKVEEGKVKFLSALNDREVRLITVTFNGSQYIESTYKDYSLAPNTFYAFADVHKFCIQFRELENLNSILIYTYMNDSKYCKVLLGAPIATKITSAADTLSGVSKDSGNTGDLIEVFVPNV